LASAKLGLKSPIRPAPLMVLSRFVRVSTNPAPPRRLPFAGSVSEPVVEKLTAMELPPNPGRLMVSVLLPEIAFAEMSAAASVALALMAAASPTATDAAVVPVAT
jgi:hypothetical protein